MPERDSFNPHEWAALRDAPHFTVLAMAQAGSSGIFGTIGEMMTAGKAVLDATAHADGLIREIAAADEVKAAQAAIRHEVDEAKPPDVSAWIRSQALAKAKQAVTILNMRAPEKVTPYSEWIQSLAQRVAEASTEGGFLGFGGERVSAGEKAFLAELQSALER